MFSEQQRETEQRGVEEEEDGGEEDTTVLGYWSNPEAEVSYSIPGSSKPPDVL